MYALQEQHGMENGVKQPIVKEDKSTMGVNVCVSLDITLMEVSVCSVLTARNGIRLQINASALQDMCGMETSVKSF